MLRPKIFIGSSVEGVKLAQALQINLEHATRCKVWHQAFPLSTSTIDALMENCLSHEFAVFLFSPDDTASIRANHFAVARDNILFESGLFIGVQGKSRVFIVTPRDLPLFHLPTDLLGLTTASYDPEWAKSDPNAALGAVAAHIMQAVERVTADEPKLDISTYASHKEGATYPLKLNIKVRNRHTAAVVIKSLRFDFSAEVAIAPNAPVKAGIYRPKFRGGRDHAGEDIYTSSYLLEPYKDVELWVPFDPNITLPDLKTKASNLVTGLWCYSCIWLDPQTRKRLYQTKL